MPAIVSSTVSRADVSAKSRSSPQPRKTRMVKPRGRGRNNFGSDEEFEREVATDSESDDDCSSVATETDSDTEPASEDIVSNGHSHILTPNTTQSSEDVPSLKHQSVKDIDGDSTPFFSAAGNWSEMVAEETANGPAELPVIEFADFNSPSIPQRTLSGPPPRKTGKASKRPQPKRAVSAPSSDRGVVAPILSPEVEEEVSELTDDQPQASTSRQQSRNSFSRPPSGHNARQAYQQRLEADPSYVPTVGEFWGHDDRLLDKDLRSLSGWWRGRWQGRGRGRGGFGFVRGRGRGAFTGPESSRPVPETSGSQETEKPPVEPPLIDQPWTHDGFEEMKKRDEKRRGAAPHQQQQAARSTRGFLPLRGRGGSATSRGRGGFARGGFTPSPTGAHFIPPAAAAAALGRTWYAMKPERVWTKQHEGFLYFDPALKPRPGQGPGYRVKLSGSEAKVVRSSARATQAADSTQSVAAPSEASEKTFVVRLPKRAGKEKAQEPTPEVVETITTAADPPIEDVFTVRPELVPPRQLIPTSQSALTPANGHVPSTSASAVPLEPAASAPSSPDISKENITSPLLQQMMRAAADQQAKETADVSNGILQEQYDQNVPALLQVEQPATNPDTSDAIRSSIPPPLQTVFSPPSQPSPPYGSPYGYGSSLPPGVAIGHHGMPYEIATGRAVYLQHPTMYTPRPLAHGVMTSPGLPYAPMHHHSTSSPDFLAPSHTPPVNGYIDPSTGNPLFAFPRQSSRIEIRSPTSHSDLKQSKSSRRPSSLRTSAASFEPSRPASPNTESQTYQSSEDPSPQDDASSSQANDRAMPEQAMEPTMYGYSPYHQQYYYPEHYGYSQYYDMSHVPQYEMYPTDPHASQVYY